MDRVKSTEQAGEKRDKHEADEGNTAAGHQLFHSLALSSRIVIAVTFEEVDCAPDRKTCAQSNNEGLENVNSRVEKIHTVFAGTND